MNKLQLILTFLFALSFSSIAKEKDTIPKKISNSIPALSNYLTSGMADPYDKVEAIYTWITHNIEYDYDKLESSKTLVGVNPSESLKSRKAICSGYVELMRAMLDEVGVESETVNGYVKDSHWTIGDTLLEETHAWIAIQIDGKWLLADPTWDAGYIGRIPKKDFKEKRYIQNSFKWEKREARVLERREERKEKRYQAWDEKDDYTNKTGFVSQPSQDYFLIHPDTFLLSHLPTNPIWQLRNEKITFLEFTQSEKSLKETIAKKQSEFPYNASGNYNYINASFLDQLILNGDDGQTFNPYNPGVKLLYYYNYLALITRKDLQKVARGSVYAITPSKHPELLAKTDTVSTYLKEYKKFEKAYYKKNKQIDKDNYKIASSNNKDLFKNAEKLEEKHDDFIDDIKKNSEKIEEQNVKYTDILNKIQQNYPKAVNYTPMASFDTSVVAHWMDSIALIRAQMDAAMDNYNAKRKNSCIKRYIYGLSFSSKILNVNQALIPYNNYSTSATINEIDSVAIAQTANLLNIIDDSIDLELLDRDIYAYIKAMEMITKQAKIEFRSLKADGQIDYPFRYETFLNAILYEEVKRALAFNSSSLNFNNNVINALKKYDYYPADILNMADKQENLKEDKYEYNANLTEKDHERSEDLFKKIEKAIKVWEAKYDDK